jgi:hypothetical protein
LCSVSSEKVRHVSLILVVLMNSLKDHPCHVCFKLAYWFQRKRFLSIFPIGSVTGIF